MGAAVAGAGVDVGEAVGVGEGLGVGLGEAEDPLPTPPALTRGEGAAVGVPAAPEEERSAGGVELQAPSANNPASNSASGRLARRRPILRFNALPS